MRVVLQKALSAKLHIKKRLHCEIGAGMVLLVGFGLHENPAHIAKMAAKIAKLRLFGAEESSFMNSVIENKLEILSVPQFTLYADIKKGRRPSFSKAIPSAQASILYQKWLAELQAITPQVKTGVFGANMQVELTNNGPVTLWLDSEQLFE